MDIQKVASTGTAAVVLGTGAFVGGNHQIDKMQGGPQKRQDAVSYTHLTLPTICSV